FYTVAIPHTALRNSSTPFISTLMAAAVNHMPSLLQSRTAFHSTVNVGCVPVRGDCSLRPQKTNNSLLFYSIVDYNPTVFTDCPLFTTRYTATNFN
ncbi:Uncharacterized protein APZ42_004577, partial [Daphnia magna]